MDGCAQTTYLLKHLGLDALPPGDESFSSPCRLSPVPGFLTPWPAVECVLAGRTLRSLAPGLPDLPPETLAAGREDRVLRLLAFIPNVPRPPLHPACAPRPGLPILGAVRLPKGEVRGVTVDGRMVAWAAARPPVCGVRQVTVETAPAYRGQGYGRSALCALTGALRQPLLYLCERDNRASAALALSAGYRQLAALTCLLERMRR